MQIPGRPVGWTGQCKKIRASPSSRIALQNSTVCPLLSLSQPRSFQCSFCPSSFSAVLFLSSFFGKSSASSRRPWIATKTRRRSLAGRTSAGILKHPVFQGNRRIDPRVSSSARNVRRARCFPRQRPSPSAFLPPSLPYLFSHLSLSFFWIV